MLQNYTSNLYYYFLENVTLTLKKQGGVFYNIIPMGGYRYGEIVKVPKNLE